MTFIIKVSGDSERLISHDYLCEVHGRFEQLVPQADPPDTVPCPFEIDCDHAGENHACVCGATAWWSPSSAPAVHTQFVVSATQGKSAPKPHRDAMDTRMIAEGRKNDYRAQRKQVREDARKRRVMELLK